MYTTLYRQSGRKLIWLQMPMCRNLTYIRIYDIISSGTENNSKNIIEQILGCAFADKAERHSDFYAAYQTGKAIRGGANEFI